MHRVEHKSYFSVCCENELSGDEWDMEVAVQLYLAAECENSFDM